MHASACMKEYEGLALQFHLFLTWNLDGRDGSPSRPSHFTAGEEPLVPSEYKDKWVSDPEASIFRLSGPSTSLPTELSRLPNRKQQIMLFKTAHLFIYPSPPQLRQCLQVVPTLQLHTLKFCSNLS